MIITFVKNWYERYERWISSISLVAGFIFDIILLQRIDLFIENVWIVVHLIAGALGIILLNLFEKGKSQGKFSEQSRSMIHFWLIIFIQFGFGGLMSTFLVFYFRSATLVTSWPFLLILAIAFACNEWLKHYFSRLVFQISLLYLSIYAFAIFGIPVLLHQIGDGVFILSGIVSLVTLGLFLVVMRFSTREHFQNGRNKLLITIIGITVGINILYFANIIPPIPLGLKDAGVYHGIAKVAEGKYAIRAEPTTGFPFFKRKDVIHIEAGEPVFVYSAVFSPTNLNTRIVHEWQYYDEAQREWVASSRIELPVIGGRDGGFRTYSLKEAVQPGAWRVDVETLRGQHIGRIHFTVEHVESTPQLEIFIK